MQRSEEGKTDSINSFQLYFQQGMAVFFALVINALDGCAFGMILFPDGITPKYSTIGVSLFLWSTILVQVAFIFTSGFTAGLGTAMAENIPFLHSMATGIKTKMDAAAAGGTSNEEQLVASILICWALSAAFNGLCFYICGVSGAGRALKFFPLHILVGIIGGFGFFLFTVGMENSTGLTWSWSPDKLKLFFEPEHVWHWVVSLALCGVLQLLQRWKPTFVLLAPLFMLAVPIVFYVILEAAVKSYKKICERNIHRLPCI